MAEVPITGWKDIAVFLGCSVRTAQRFERELGLPLHRTQVSKGAVVRGYPSELRAWLENRSKVGTHFAEGDPAPSPETGERGVVRRHYLVVASVAGAAISLGALIWVFLVSFGARADAPSFTKGLSTPEKVSAGQASSARRISLEVRAARASAPVHVEVQEGDRAVVALGGRLQLILQPLIRGRDLLLDVRRPRVGSAEPQRLVVVRLALRRSTRLEVDGMALEITWTGEGGSPAR